MGKYKDYDKLLETFKQKQIIMGGILTTLDRAIGAIQKDLIESKILYVELDKENYELLLAESENYSFVVQEQKVADIGKCTVLTYMDYKIIVSVNKDKPKMDDFYLAFKTKII